jgi:DNA (cytosine-5)-methyltransferase 1
MLHLDLFSGIGGFALAVDRVWPEAEHVFCDNNLFCQQVLKKHWPNSKIYDDIRTITDNLSADVLTGGFPCQPFSQAGRRRGTADNRYLWPEMFRVIQLTKPTWVIAENVGGFVTWNEGLVLEQVCTDLESENYEVQTFIIPAVSVNAPHRRERVWIVANSQGGNPSDPPSIRRENGVGMLSELHRPETRIGEREGLRSHRRWEGESWVEVATRICRVDDGIPGRLDRIKSLGNAIVPQVAEQIMRAIKLS